MGGPRERLVHFEPSAHGVVIRRQAERVPDTRAKLLIIVIRKLGRSSRCRELTHKAVRELTPCVGDQISEAGLVGLAAEPTAKYKESSEVGIDLF